MSRLSNVVPQEHRILIGVKGTAGQEGHKREGIP